MRLRHVQALLAKGVAAKTLQRPPLFLLQCYPYSPAKPSRIAAKQAKRHFRRLRMDTYLGMGVSNLIAYFMIVATAATLHVHGITDIATTSQAAQALEPIAGRFASLLFAAGVVGTGLLALPVLAGSAAYAVAGLFQIRIGWHHPPGKARAFTRFLEEPGPSA